MIFLLLNFLWIPQVGRFSCSVTPWFLASAQADSGCPESWQEAVNDDQWLRDRLDSIKGEDVTTGIAYDVDGEPTRFTSGQDDAAQTVVEVGREIGVFPQVGSPTVVDHVEMKVAATMRRENLTQTILLINNVEGPCGPDETKPYTCSTLVPKLLAPGAELLVFWEDAKGLIQSQRFVGEGA